jgi:CheY-like chemotaxis protein
MVAFKLANAGHEVVRVVDGESAPAEAAREPPDVIILDVMMPVLDGFAVLARLKADPALRAIPVIVLTARGQERDILTGLQGGAADDIVKPFSLKELLARVDVAPGSADAVGIRHRGYSGVSCFSWLASRRPASTATRFSSSDSTSRRPRSSSSSVCWSPISARQRAAWACAVTPALESFMTLRSGPTAWGPPTSPSAYTALSRTLGDLSRSSTLTALKAGRHRSAPRRKIARARSAGGVRAL